jgi:cell division septation protein DedD
MDWIRRNWPDLLIGLALLAVIGGIIATLLNGGNFLPTNRPTATNTTTTVSGGNTTTIEPTTISPELPSGTTTIAGEDGAETTGTITPVDINATTEAVTDAATNAVEAAVDAVTTEETAEPSTPTETETAEAVVTPTSDTTSYRISVGAFGSVANAERRAQTFRDAGYPVFVGKQGDLSLVLIGPFDSQAAAKQAVSQIQSSGLEANPIIYEFTPADAAAAADTTSSATATESTSTETTSSVATEALTTETTSETTVSTGTTISLPTSNTGRYLQVGAYSNVEGAQPQLIKLQGLGFSVTYIEENAKIKLLVGPYEGATLETAKAQLSAQGIDHFVR